MAHADPRGMKINPNISYDPKTWCNEVVRNKVGNESVGIVWDNCLEQLTERKREKLKLMSSSCTRKQQGRPLKTKMHGSRVDPRIHVQTASLEKQTKLWKPFMQIAWVVADKVLCTILLFVGKLTRHLYFEKGTKGREQVFYVHICETPYDTEGVAKLIHVEVLYQIRTRNKLVVKG